MSLAVFLQKKKEKGRCEKEYNMPTSWRVDIIKTNEKWSLSDLKIARRKEKIGRYFFTTKKKEKVAER